MEYKTAVFTLATNQNYLKGARLMYETYLRHNDLPFYIMVGPGQDISGYEDLPLVVVNHIKPSGEPYHGEGTVKYDVFSKMNCFLFTQYDYILFVDVDVIISERLNNYIEKGIDFLKKANSDLLYGSKNFDLNRGGVCDANIGLLKPNRNIYKEALVAMEYFRDEEQMLYALKTNHRIKAVGLDEGEDYMSFQEGILDFTIPIGHLHFHAEKTKFGNDEERLAAYYYMLNDHNKYITCIENGKNGIKPLFNQNK